VAVSETTPAGLFDVRTYGYAGLINQAAGPQ